MDRVYVLLMNRMSYFHHTGCFVRLHGAVHQRHHCRMWWLQTNTALISTTVSNPETAGDMVTVTYGLMPPFLVWCLNIRLFEMLLLFQVSLTGQGCKQISHKDFHCRHHSQALSKHFFLTSRHCILVWCLLVEDVRNYRAFDCLCFPVCVTALFFIHSDNGVVSDWDLYSRE